MQEIDNGKQTSKPSNEDKLRIFNGFYAKKRLFLLFPQKKKLFCFHQQRRATAWMKSYSSQQWRYSLCFDKKNKHLQFEWIYTRSVFPSRRWYTIYACIHVTLATWLILKREMCFVYLWSSLVSMKKQLKFEYLSAYKNILSIFNAPNHWDQYWRILCRCDNIKLPWNLTTVNHWMNR